MFRTSSLGCIATHLLKKAGFSRKSAQAGAVTLIQRFGSTLNLPTHSPVCVMDGVFEPDPQQGARFIAVAAPDADDA